MKSRVAIDGLSDVAVLALWRFYGAAASRVRLKFSLDGDVRALRRIFRSLARQFEQEASRRASGAGFGFVELPVGGHSAVRSRFISSWFREESALFGLGIEGPLENLRVLAEECRNFSLVLAEQFQVGS